MNELLFFAALLHAGDTRALRLIERKHLEGTWADVYDWILEFVREHGKLPRAMTVGAHFSVQLDPPPEEASYYARLVRENAMRAFLEEGFSHQVVPPLAESDPQRAIDATSEVLSRVKAEFPEPDDSRGYLVTSSNVAERRADYRLRKNASGRLGLPLPWPTMTRYTNGLCAGDLWGIIGRPESGKTWASIVVAVYHQQIGNDVVLLSMETPPRSSKPKDPRHRARRGRCLRCGEQDPNTEEECEPAKIARQRLMNRIDAVGARVSAWRFLNGKLQPQEEVQIDQYWKMSENPSAYGWGNLTVVSPPAVRSLAQAEQVILERKPDLFVWDSAFLAIPKGKRGKRTDRAGEFIEEMKDLADRCDVPVLFTWHFNRDVKPNDTDGTINEIALTDDMGRIVDVMFALYRTPELRDAGEAMWDRLKIRDGIDAPAFKSHFSMQHDLRFDEIGPV